MKSTTTASSAAAQPLPSPTDPLPFPVYTNIFSFLDRKDLRQASNVCSRWRSVVVSYNLLSEKCSAHDIRETNLWTLHNRVSEAEPGGMLHDPKAIEIYKSIDFDYNGSFGTPYNSQAIRSLVFDQAILEYWEEHPNGTVVNLGEGLETQRYRLEHRKLKESKWITVDLPNAIFIREQFMKPDDSHLHIAASALDVEVWAPKVPLDKPVFITAQGLFMYLPETEVMALFRSVAKWFPGSTMMFDTICKHFSTKTMGGVQWTKHYTVPKMPFGVNRFDAPVLFKSWVSEELQVEEVRVPIEKMTGWRGYVAPILMHTPFLRGYMPKMTFCVGFPSAKKQANFCKLEVDSSD